MKTESNEALRELKRLAASYRGTAGAFVCVDKFCNLIAQLPEPPPPNPIEECCRVWSLTEPRTDGHRVRMRAALSRYRELGCPELDP